MAATLGAWLCACTAVVAADFWEDKDFTAWSEQEVRRMLTDSPWSREVTVLSTDSRLASRVGGLSGGIIGGGVGSRGGIGAAGGGAGGDGAGNLGGGSFMAAPRRTRGALRWTSALPVQLAMRRSQGADAADAQSLLEEDEPFYRVAVGGIPLELTEIVGGIWELQDVTALNRMNREPIRPVDIRLVSDEDVLTIEFRFPRTEPITIDDREVQFVTKLGEANVRQTFKLRDMMFAGKLAL